MRLTVVILITMFVQVHATTFGQSVTLHIKDASLNEVMEAIRTQTGYDFFYSKELVRKARPITIDVTEASIQEVLEICFRDQALDFRIDNKVVMIREKEPELIDVRGHVTDSTGAPLPGAGVRIKDSNIGTVTDANGDFRLNNIEEGAVLEISFIGFAVHEVIVTKQNAQNITVALKEDSRLLQEVMVFSNGYQTISKERSTGSFAQADMSIVSERSSSMNILARLDGQIPGLSVNMPYYSANNTGRDLFLVRGATTIGAPNKNGISFDGTSRTPLFVVDGVVVSDVSFVNPQDVKDVTVLKDATAASIWGSRAANGVIVITTKKGTYDSKIKVNYDGFINFQGRPDLDFYPVMNSQEYIASARELFADPAYQTANPWSTYANSKNLGTAPYPHEVILYNQLRGRITTEQANAALDSLAQINNRGQISDLFYRNAMLMNHTLSLSGGGSKHSFYGSFAYTDTKNTTPGDVNNTYKINLRQDFKINDALQFFLITDLTQARTSAKRNAKFLDSSTPYTTFNPYQLFRDPEGNNVSIPYRYLLDSARQVYESKSRISLDYNPLDEFNRGYTKGDGLTTRIVGGGNIKLFKGLRFEGTYSYMKGTTKSIEFEAQESFAVRSELVAFTLPPATATAAPTYLLPEKGGRYTVLTTDLRNWTVRNQLVYDNKWGVHQLTALAGQEAQAMLSQGHNSRVRGYDEILQIFVPVDYAALGKGVTGTVMPNLSGVISQLASDNFSSTEIESRYTSYYANAGYTYNRKYSLNASWRIDQSTLFGKDKSAQNKPVWSAGVKWLVSNEDFMQNVSWVESLALRFTYGLTGNSPNAGAVSSRDIVTATGNTFFPGGKGLGIVTTGNPKLTWESTKTTNVGVDVTVLHGRLDATIDVYRKYTEDLLGLISTNSFTGYPNVIGNMGDMTNKGVEIGLHSVNIQQGYFRWNTSVVIGYNKNEVVKHTRYTPVTTAAQEIPNPQFQEGYPSFALFAYDFVGLDNMGDPQIKLHDGTVTKLPGAAMAEDAKYMGTIQPIWTGGFSNTFRYKNFQLSANAIFNLGHVMRRTQPLQSLYWGPLRGNLSSEFLNRWKTEGDEAYTNVPSYEPNVSLSVGRRSLDYYVYGDANVVSASYIKFRDITLMYHLPESVVRRIRAEGVSLRAQLSNVMLWKANKDGLDPEFQGGIVPINQRTITLGAHLTF